MSSLLTTPGGRTYDVMALRGQRAAGEAALAQDVLAGGGQLGTGIVKLAQWFVATFSTVAGSLPFAPDQGTAFFADLAAGRLRTEADVFVAFSFAVGDLLAQARQAETDATPADERFADATLEEVALAPGLLRLHATLHTAAGATRPVVLPIPLDRP